MYIVNADVSNEKSKLPARAITFSDQITQLLYWPKHSLTFSIFYSISTSRQVCSQTPRTAKPDLVRRRLRYAYHREQPMKRR